MKRIAVALIGLVLFGAACSSEPKSAKDKYAAFMKKYDPVVKDFEGAFGNADSSSFDEYVADGEGCEPIDDESVGGMTLFLGPVLAEHGFSVPTFIKDLREVNSAIVAEGLCAETTTTTVVEETTTTTFEDVGRGEAFGNEYESPECREAIRKTNSYLRSLPNVSAYDKAVLNPLFAEQYRICEVEGFVPL